VIYDPRKVTYAQLVKAFFENHDPTQGMRQGGDVGTQYRSAIYYHNDQQKAIVEEMSASFNRLLQKAGYPAMTTEILPAPEFYYAEEYHQQYLHKVPDGYCGLKGTGVTCAVSRQDTVNLTEELELPTTGGE
jgi:peptide-methionine (S)-S-oxide reductase